MSVPPLRIAAQNKPEKPFFSTQKPVHSFLTECGISISTFSLIAISFAGIVSSHTATIIPPHIRPTPFHRHHHSSNIFNNHSIGSFIPTHKKTPHHVVVSFRCFVLFCCRWKRLLCQQSRGEFINSWWRGFIQRGLVSFACISYPLPLCIGSRRHFSSFSFSFLFPLCPFLLPVPFSHSFFPFVFRIHFSSPPSPYPFPFSPFFSFLFFPLRRRDFFATC